MCNDAELAKHQVGFNFLVSMLVDRIVRPAYVSQLPLIGVRSPPKVCFVRKEKSVGGLTLSVDCCLSVFVGVP